MERKIRVGGAETGDKIVFEGLNSPFSSVASVEAGLHKLEVDFFLMEVIFKNGGAFIVEATE